MEQLNCYECGAEASRLTSAHNVSMKEIIHPVTGKPFKGGASVSICDDCLKRAEALGYHVKE